MLNSCQLMGEVGARNQLFPFTGEATFGSGYSCSNRTPAGSKAVITYGLDGVASPYDTRLAGCGSPQLGFLKSPFLSARVGTQAWRGLPRFSLFHSML